MDDKYFIGNLQSDGLRTVVYIYRPDSLILSDNIIYVRILFQCSTMCLSKPKSPHKNLRHY